MTADASADTPPQQPDKPPDARQNAAKANKLYDVPLYISLAATVVSMAIVGVVFMRRLEPRMERMTEAVGTLYEKTGVLHGKMDAAITVFERRLDTVEKQVKALQTVPDGTKAHAEVAALKDVTEDIDGRLSHLEAALGQDPASALSIPLLKRDVQGLRDASDALEGEIDKQVDRIYDQNKWFIGLMLTFAIALIGLVVSNLLQLAKKSDRTGETSNNGIQPTK